MVDIDKSKPVLVTGATGYVAGWIVKRLLEEGATVHAAVRDPGNAEKLRYLNEIAVGLPGTIRYFKADLLDEGSYAEAMAGCEVVFHTASPFFRDVKDAQTELVDPAVKGTRNVLETANRTESVRRVVVTSSCAAIYGDAADIATYPGQVMTEQCWNSSSSLDHNPYPYSKVLAEKEAWKIAEAQSRWKLVVINPGFVLGPAINPYGEGESFAVIRQMGGGPMKAGIPAIGIGVIDVRDLAEAHLRAGFLPEANGRNIIVAENTSLLDLAATLRPKFPRYPLPKSLLPKWLVWLVGPLADKSTTRKFISRNVGHPWKADNSKSVRELGMSYRPIAQTMQDMFQQIVDTGQIPVPKG
ncbi:NAD-dependent epimerase/dehydratase family protein [Sphingobium sp. Sx8-8]|uniref:NAD-dependent epimerase/dehydratase family protein n=1 Tax=Sphingobium sp. Sx8-8 TaxID=2933617 RepID=UPI001F56817A|nr:NAD-dependent epimerase/dehydratase family protein [Sphingobium sp. Sx8-8]